MSLEAGPSQEMFPPQIFQRVHLYLLHPTTQWLLGTLQSHASQDTSRHKGISPQINPIWGSTPMAVSQLHAARQVPSQSNNKILHKTQVMES